MGYVRADHASIGTQVKLVVRGKPLPAKIVALPFVPNNFYRG
jgi:aminomethyltransferase